MNEDDFMVLGDDFPNDAEEAVLQKWRQNRQGLQDLQQRQGRWVRSALVTDVAWCMNHDAPYVEWLDSSLDDDDDPMARCVAWFDNDTECLITLEARVTYEKETDDFRG